MSTAVTPFLPPEDEWRRTVDLSTRIAATEFVPTALRGKPEAVLAAMLVGRELGIGALEALRSIHVIEGKPTESAELLHALVLRAGHDLYVAEATSERCEVRYRRAGSPPDRPEGRVVWTIEDAVDADLVELRDGKPYKRDRNGKPAPWERYPRAMLRSRAVSETCRQAFPDVVKGAGYVAEELGAPEETVVAQANEVVTVEAVAREVPEEVPVTPEPAAEPPSEAAELAERRRLYAAAREAYSRIAAADSERAALAWTAAMSGLEGANAPAAFQSSDLAILEGRVADLERVADDVAPDEDDEGGTAAPEPEPEPDPEPEAPAEEEPAEDEGTVEEPEPTPVDCSGDPPPRPAAKADPLDELDPDTAAAWRATNVRDALAILSGERVTVGIDAGDYVFDLSDLSEPERNEAVGRLERSLDKPRRTVTSRIGPGRDESSRAAPEASSGTTPPEGSGSSESAAPEARGKGHTFEQPDGMDPGEWTRRVALYRRWERARDQVDRARESDPHAEAHLDAIKRSHTGQVGRDPAGAMHVPESALVALVEDAEARATQVVPF